EHIRIQTGEEVSWLRLTDECSGAVLWTAVFPPRNVGAGPCLRRARPAPLGVCLLGPAPPTAGRQRHTVGFHRRVPHGAGLVADRTGDHDALEPPQAAAGKRRRRALAGHLRSVVRALDLCHPPRIAVPPGADGPAASR